MASAENIAPTDPYDLLGPFVSQQSPYGNDAVLPPLDDPDVLDMTDETFAVKISKMLYDDNHVVVRTGLHETDTADHHQTFKPSSDFTIPERDKLLPWRFGGRDYTVTKAIRIWYNYKAENADGTPVIDPDTGQQRIVGTFLLVGYVGNGQP